MSDLFVGSLTVPDVPTVTRGEAHPLLTQSTVALPSNFPPVNRVLGAGRGKEEGISREGGKGGEPAGSKRQLRPPRCCPRGGNTEIFRRKSKNI